MANAKDEDDNNPFDLDRIRNLVGLMRKNDLSEIDLRWENKRVRIRRGAENVVVASTPMAPAPRSAPVVNADQVPAAAPASASTPAANSVTINSPLVGTYYAASGPDAKPFVAVGARVTPETTVCIIEAMKVFNDVPSGVTGVITEILVENGAMVEYGQPLFRVAP